MYELGKKKETFGADQLKPLDQSVKMRVFAEYGSGRPIAFPDLGPDISLICGYNQGLGERLIVCETLEDMQTLYDGYAGGRALGIYWYTGADVGFVYVITGGEPPSNGFLAD